MTISSRVNARKSNGRQQFASCDISIYVGSNERSATSTDRISKGRAAAAAAAAAASGPAASDDVLFRFTGVNLVNPLNNNDGKKSLTAGCSNSCT